MDDYTDYEDTQFRQLISRTWSIAEESALYHATVAAAGRTLATEAIEYVRSTVK